MPGRRGKLLYVCCMQKRGTSLQFRRDWFADAARCICSLDCSWEHYVVTIDTLANAVAATSGLTCLGLKGND
jgi:hypothetical protein